MDRKVYARVMLIARPTIRQQAIWPGCVERASKGVWCVWTGGFCLAVPGLRFEKSRRVSGRPFDRHHDFWPRCASASALAASWGCQRSCGGAPSQQQEGLFQVRDASRGRQARPGARCLILSLLHLRVWSTSIAALPIYTPPPLQSSSTNDSTRSTLVAVVSEDGRRWHVGC